MSSLLNKKLTQEDRIINYLTHPGKTEISKTDRETLEACQRIHALRHGYHRRAQLIKVIERTENVGNRQAYNLLYQTETIFGKIEGVNKEYIRNLLIDEALENIKRAKAISPTAHTKAILAAFKVAGLEETLPDMPNFADLIQHIYNINLPPDMIEAFKTMMGKGAVNITEEFPPPDISTDKFDEATEVNDEPA